jgi:hypothetical protein
MSLSSFTLSENVDEASVLAEFKDGVFTMRPAKTDRAKVKAVDAKDRLSLRVLSRDIVSEAFGEQF